MLGAFLLALQSMESGGNYQVVNTLNYLGAYQFGEAALNDLGFVFEDDDPYDNDYSGGWTGKDGIHSAADFLRDHQAQDRAAREWIELLWRYAQMQDLDRYAGSEIGGIELTPSGMVAAMHLLGADALEHFIESDGQADIRDPYGTPLASYIVKLAGYELPFALVQPSG